MSRVNTRPSTFNHMLMNEWDESISCKKTINNWLELISRALVDMSNMSTTTTRKSRVHEANLIHYSRCALLSSHRRRNQSLADTFEKLNINCEIGGGACNNVGSAYAFDVFVLWSMRCCCHQHINFKQHSSLVAYTLYLQWVVENCYESLFFGRINLPRHNNDNDHISRPHSNELFRFMHEQLTQVNAALSLVWYLCCPFIGIHVHILYTVICRNVFWSLLHFVDVLFVAVKNIFHFRVSQEMTWHTLYHFVFSSF